MSYFRESLQKRRLLTGESQRQLLHRRAGQPPYPHARIPSAVGDQALLEAWVMHRLQRAWRGLGTRPLGVSRIRVPEYRTPTIHLDERRSVGSSVALRWCEELLPCGGPDGETECGVPGLRVLRIAGCDLVVGLAGTAATLTVRAACSWREVLQLRRLEAEQAGSIPQWDLATPLRAHEDYEMWLLTDLASLGSALLRRLAIFHQLGTPYIVDGWENPDTWILELTTEDISACSPDLARRHDEFLALLLDQHLGLPLRVDKVHCVCTQPFGYGTACYYSMVQSADPASWQLQIRFRWIPGQRNDMKSWQSMTRLRQ